MGAVDCCTNDSRKNADHTHKPKNLVTPEGNIPSGPIKLDSDDRWVFEINKKIAEAKNHKDLEMKTVFYKHQQQSENLDSQETW